MYEFRHVRGHIEVYLCGEFLLSADTEAEARKEVFAIDKARDREACIRR